LGFRHGTRINNLRTAGGSLKFYYFRVPGGPPKENYFADNSGDYLYAKNMQQ